MGYNNSNYGVNNGGYQRQGNSNYGNNGGGYQKSNYSAPQPKQFVLEDEASKYAMIYLTLVEQLKAGGVPIEDVKDFLGGWTTSLKLSFDKAQ